jgi:hypothetical protein
MHGNSNIKRFGTHYIFPLPDLCLDLLTINDYDILYMAVWPESKCKKTCIVSNVTLRRVRTTNVAVEKQNLLHILSVCM